MSQRPHIRELAENLLARRRLGLRLVQGEPQGLESLVSLLLGQPPAQGLQAIRAGLGECRRCPLAQGRTRIVFGQGPEPARLMLIGEAPGAMEDKEGLPFVGPAGQLLDRMLASVGLRRPEVYITNLVKCRPPENRDPRPEEAAACRPFLEAQIAALRPRVICALGRPAAQALLDTDAPISALRGKWAALGPTPLLPTFHPAFLLRNPERKAQAYADLKALALALKGA